MADEELLKVAIKRDREILRSRFEISRMIAWQAAPVLHPKDVERAESLSRDVGVQRERLERHASRLWLVHSVDADVSEECSLFAASASDAVGVPVSLARLDTSLLLCDACGVSRCTATADLHSRICECYASIRCVDCDGRVKHDCLPRLRFATSLAVKIMNRPSGPYVRRLVGGVRTGEPLGVFSALSLCHLIQTDIVVGLTAEEVDFVRQNTVLVVSKLREVFSKTPWCPSCVKASSAKRRGGSQKKLAMSSPFI